MVTNNIQLYKNKEMAEKGKRWKIMQENTDQEDYEKEYGCKLYSIWVYELIPYSEEYARLGWWNGRKRLGFSGHALAHSLGSLEHLREYGVSFEE